MQQRERKRAETRGGGSPSLRGGGERGGTRRGYHRKDESTDGHVRVLISIQPRGRRETMSASTGPPVALSAQVVVDLESTLLITYLAPFGSLPSLLVSTYSSLFGPLPSLRLPLTKVRSTPASSIPTE